MNFEYLEETIVDQIQILAEELGGKMTKSTRCDSTGKLSKIISIEYDITKKKIPASILEKIGQPTRKEYQGEILVECDLEKYQ